MNRYLTLAVASLLLTTGLAFASPDNDALKAKDTAAWQAFKDKKGDDFKKIAGANMVAVYDDGVADMTKELADMQKWDMKSFAISDYKVTMSGADTAVATYVVKVDGTMAGQNASGTMNAATVWKQTGGEWQALFHTNIAQAASRK
jgi:hypothetical protein